ncbi:acidic mammalian chitinase-like [Scyliorhinus torazame]|uniref:acidic mammalian chitinase-like n=1 Tax=Scyliorhinus torazame TaxID=75743 RepID=UPI003B59D21C
MGKALLLTVSLVFLQYVSLVSPYVLLCYYIRSSNQRLPSIMFYPENIDPCLCTHLIYSDNKEIANTYHWKDDPLFKRFTDLKKNNKNLKTLYGFGGWSFGISRFSIIAAKLDSRIQFINSAVPFLRKHGFDGLDLDWRYPGYRGTGNNDKYHFTIFMKELMEAFIAEAQTSGKDRLLLTAPVAANKKDIDAGYEIAEVSKYLDFISVLTLQFNGPWNKLTAHNSPLHRGSADKGEQRNFNVDYVLKYWRDRGAPAAKLLVTFPTYGNSYILKTSKTGIGAPVTVGGSISPYTGQRGFLPYHEICPFLKGATKKMIEDQKVPYAFKGNEWVGYDDQQSFKTKAQWLKDNNFGGATLWTLDMDDYSGTHCNQGLYPLTNTLKTALGISNSECKSSFITSPQEVELKTWCSDQPNGFYPFPIDSHKYFNCARGHSYIMSCPAGLNFDISCHCCDIE